MAFLMSTHIKQTSHMCLLLRRFTEIGYAFLEECLLLTFWLHLSAHDLRYPD